MPIPLFLVDFDLRVLEANSPAVRLAKECGGREPAALQRCCEMLRCHDWPDPAAGRGDAACRRCDIRTSVGRAVYGGSRTRKRISVSTAAGSNGSGLHCLLVVSPLNQEGRRLALVALVPAGTPSTAATPA